MCLYIKCVCIVYVKLYLLDNYICIILLWLRVIVKDIFYLKKKYRVKFV